MSIEQHNPTDNTEDKSEVVLAGTILREKREALGLTQKQIADRLRLRVAIIQKIESNEFDGEQVATFTRGYLRSYAKAVGVDEHKVLGAVEPHGHAHHDELPMQSFSKKTNKEKHDSRIMKLTWGIFIVIIGISSVWWLQNQQKDTLSEIAETSDPAFQVEEPAPEDEAISAALTIEEEPTKTLDVSTIIEQPQPEVVPEIVPEEAKSLTSDAADESATEMESAPVVTETSQPKPEQPKAENGLTNLTMTFNGDCWIQVKDANGKTVSTGIKKQGESLNLNGKAPFKVILGAPEKVSMTFASEPVDLSGYTSGKVARFTLP